MSLVPDVGTMTITKTRLLDITINTDKDGLTCFGCEVRRFSQLIYADYFKATHSSCKCWHRCKTGLLKRIALKGFNSPYKYGKECVVLVISDILVWVEKFSTMTTILVKRFLEKAPELFAYQACIVRCERNYGVDSGHFTTELSGGGPGIKRPQLVSYQQSPLLRSVHRVSTGYTTLHPLFLGRPHGPGMP